MASSIHSSPATAGAVVADDARPSDAHVLFVDRGSFMTACFRSTAAMVAGSAWILLALATSATAGSYDFLAAPQIDLNRIFRLDKATGEIGACQFGLKEGSPGVTLCYPPGQGAGPQGGSDYALVASRHEGEGGVWRVDLRTGMMSICYVLSDAVVCTPLAR